MNTSQRPDKMRQFMFWLMNHFNSITCGKCKIFFVVRNRNAFVKNLFFVTSLNTALVTYVLVNSIESVNSPQKLVWYRIVRAFDIRIATMWMLLRILFLGQRFFSFSFFANGTDANLSLGSLIDRICLCQAGICNENIEHSDKQKIFVYQKRPVLRYL